jgi:hypothetical protein
VTTTIDARTRPAAEPKRAEPTAFTFFVYEIKSFALECA